MAKKCIPGVICVENMTVLICVLLFIVLLFTWFQLNKQNNHHPSNTANENSTSLGTNTQHTSNASSMVLLPTTHSQHPTVVQAVHSSVPIQDVRGDVGRCTMSGGTVGDPLTNPYVPPVRCDAGGLMTAPLTMTVPTNSIPINVPTQHYNTQYNQVGILTKQFGSNHDILPLMGRRTPTSRDKWQYYTVAGGGAGGNLQTKLPVKTKGRNCSGEYGCDEIYSGDDVYVEGYQEVFHATIYESGMFSYIPI